MLFNISRNYIFQPLPSRIHPAKPPSRSRALHPAAVAAVAAKEPPPFAAAATSTHRHGGFSSHPFGVRLSCASLALPPCCGLHHTAKPRHTSTHGAYSACSKRVKATYRPDGESRKNFAALLIPSCRLPCLALSKLSMPFSSLRGEAQPCDAARKSTLLPCPLPVGLLPPAPPLRGISRCPEGLHSLGSYLIAQMKK